MECRVVDDVTGAALTSQLSRSEAHGVGLARRLSPLGDAQRRRDECGMGTRRRGNPPAVPGTSVDFASGSGSTSGAVAATFPGGSGRVAEARSTLI